KCRNRAGVPARIRPLGNEHVDARGERHRDVRRRLDPVQDLHTESDERRRVAPACRERVDAGLEDRDDALRRGRLALVTAIDGGLSLKAAAAAFNVSPATAHRWWHRWLDG